MLNLKRMVSVLLLGMFHLPAIANSDITKNDDAGWFVGGALGYVEFDGKYNNAPSFVVTNTSFDRDAGSFSIYGGYHFNQYLGIEAAIRDSGNVSEGNYYDASISEIAITPKITLPIGKQVSFYAKGGITLASYVETLDYTLPWEDEDYYWGGAGLTAGIGMQAEIVKHIILRLSYDYSDIEFEPVDDIAYRGGSYYWVPEIDATLGRTSIGVHYQF